LAGQKIGATHLGNKHNSQRLNGIIEYLFLVAMEPISGQDPNTIHTLALAGSFLRLSL